MTEIWKVERYSWVSECGCQGETTLYLDGPQSIDDEELSNVQTCQEGLRLWEEDNESSRAYGDVLDTYGEDSLQEVFAGRRYDQAQQALEDHLVHRDNTMKYTPIQ